MRDSRDHILTSHAGSLPRPDALIEANQRATVGRRRRRGAFQEQLQAAVVDVVRRQKELGVDVPGDGEFGKSMGHRVNYGAWWQLLVQRLGGLDLERAWRCTTWRRSARSPARCVLTSFADRRDRQRFAAAYADPDSGITTGPRAGDVAGLRRPDHLHRPRCDQARHRQLQGGARGQRRRGRLHDLDRARQRLAHRQRLLQDRRRVHVRLRRRDARGIQGDRRCRADPAARRSGDRRELGHDQSGAHASRTTRSSPWCGSRR